MKEKLKSKNITINGRRTSLRLERISWDAMVDICQCEGLTIHELCTLIDNRREGASRTSAVRAFIVSYYRAAATESGALQKGIASTVLLELAARM